jgi:hypothetical protein
MKLNNIQSTISVPSSVVIDSNDACPIKDCEKRRHQTPTDLRLGETVAETDDDCRDCIHQYS